jgi:hypothetical protein
MLDIASLLDCAPAPLRRFAYRVAGGRGVLGRFADAVRFRYRANEVPVLPPIADSAVRLIIGPANSAGQGRQWARAAERFLPDVAAFAMRGVGADEFLSEVDLRVPVGVYQRSPVWHESFESFLTLQTHVIWESGHPLLGRRYGSDVRRDIAVLEDAGVRGALMFHGSDIRPPAAHAAVNPWSPFPASPAAARALESEAARNAALVVETQLPAFVSTPDLLEWLPDATWCPVTIDPARWQLAAKVEGHSGRPVVVHAPSRAWLKGSGLIEPLLQRLSGEGVIEYRRAVGVPHASMPAFYAEADVVLDQFVLGIYGVAACEAMAAGRLVMSHVAQFTRDAVRERSGWELPVHETTLDSLEGELRRFAATPETFESVRAAGPAFVRSTHDGRRSAKALAPFLRLSV